jgi:glycosyltransferase involved in cell wall biosynthesis
MKVVHVNDIAFVGSTLVDGLRAAGADARLIQPRTPGASMPYPWKVVTYPFRAWPLIATALNLRRASAQIVHVHYASQALPALLSGHPYVVHCHGSDIRGVSGSSPAGRWMAPVLARASTVLYSTPDLARWIGQFRRDALFMPNPIDTSAFAPAVSLPLNASDVLVATRLDPIKGVDDIIFTIECIRSLRPTTTFTIIANGPDVGRAIAAAGRMSKVIPTVRHHEMPGILHGHRVAIGQFKLGILSQVELEAMASGVPIATSFTYKHVYDAPPPLMPASTPEEAAKSVADLLEDPVALRHLSTVSRSWVLDHHDVALVVERLLRIYREILEA